MKSEPVYAHAAILSILQAGIPFGILMGWLSMSNEQLAALMIFANTILTLMAAIATRSIVWAPASHETVVTTMETEFKEAFYAPGHPEGSTPPTVTSTVTTESGPGVNPEA